MESSSIVHVPIAEYKAMENKIKELEEIVSKIKDNPEAIILIYDENFNSSQRYRINLKVINTKNEGINYLGKIIQDCIAQNELLGKNLWNIESKYKFLQMKLQEKYKIKDEDFRI